MLIFSTANTFFQLNLVFITESRTGFRFRLLWKYQLNVRSRHWSRSLKKDVLKNFTNFTERHLCWSVLSIELSGLQLYQKVYPTQVFGCGICEIFKHTYFEKHLLLKPVQILPRLPIFGNLYFLLKLVRML